MNPQIDIAEQLTPSPVRVRMNHYRRELMEQLEIFNKVEAMLTPLPQDILDHCNPTGGYLQISNLNREQVKEVMSKVRPDGGRWEKSVNGACLEYTAQVSGVRVLLYGVQPPETCRIEEIEVAVPAHIAKKRVLVCK